MSKLRIGWYCPYTLPPLKKIEGIKAVQITWNSNSSSINGSLGAAKLCKKLTAIQEKVREESLDGIVMTDCCTLSRSLCSFIKEQKYPLFIHEMYIPRKADLSFENKLLREWDKLTFSIHSLLSQNYAEAITNKTSKYAIHEENLFVGNGWCELPQSIVEYLSLTGNDRKEIVIQLLGQAKCPRLISKNTGEDEQRIAPDRQCLIQSYRSIMT